MMILYKSNELRRLVLDCAPAMHAHAPVNTQRETENSFVGRMSRNKVELGMCIVQRYKQKLAKKSKRKVPLTKDTYLSQPQTLR